MNRPSASRLLSLRTAFLSSRQFPTHLPDPLNVLPKPYHTHDHLSIHRVKKRWYQARRPALNLYQDWENDECKLEVLGTGKAAANIDCEIVRIPDDLDKQTAHMKKQTHLRRKLSETVKLTIGTSLKVPNSDVLSPERGENCGKCKEIHPVLALTAIESSEFLNSDSDLDLARLEIGQKKQKSSLRLLGERYKGESHKWESAKGLLSREEASYSQITAGMLSSTFAVEHRKSIRVVPKRLFKHCRSITE